MIDSLRLTWTIEVLILASGIYLFLRFLRSTRGSGVLRGLAIAFLVAVVVLYGVARASKMEELKHILDSITPYVAVILTILFQPELRRAIARLGEHDRLARILGARRSGTVHEVAQAALEMAAQRQGALIAFQRETSLEAYVQSAVRIDAEVRKLLLENIFHPGSALHDGGVVIQNDRIAGAACIFPLTENPDISKSTGTRHRAGLGLTEETDAVTLIVSEETGAIAVCHRGHMDRHVAADRLESLLLERLGYDLEDRETSSKRRRGIADTAMAGVRFVRHLLFADVPRKLAAIALGIVIIFAANQELTDQATVDLQIAVSTPGSPATGGALAIEIRLPSKDYSLVSPDPSEKLLVDVDGTRAELERLRRELHGLLTVGGDLPPGGIPFPIGDVVWGTGTADQVRASFKMHGEPPLLRIQRYDVLERPSQGLELPIDPTGLDPRLQVLGDRIHFDPDVIKVRGPAAAIERLRSGDLRLELQPVRLTAADQTRRTVELHLAEPLREDGLEITNSATATLDIAPAERVLAGVEKEIVVVPAPANPADPGSPKHWTVSQYEHSARFSIRTAGLIPVELEPGQQAYSEIVTAIRDYVHEHLDVVVNVKDAQDKEGTTVPVRYFWPPSNWRAELSKRIGNEVEPFAELDVILLSEARVRLTTEDAE